MSKYIVLLIFIFSSTRCISQDTTGAILMLSDKIGPVIDVEERNYYRLFMGVKNFESAVLLQRPDSSYMFKIVTRKIEKPFSGIIWRPTNPEEIGRVRNHIETYKEMQTEVSRSSDSTSGSRKLSGEFLSGVRQLAYEGICFRGRPIGRCGYFLLTELGLRYNMTGNGPGNNFDDEWTVPFTVGLMKNVGPRKALGGTIGLDPGTNNFGWFLSFGPRYRYWLSRHTSLDGSVSLAYRRGVRNIRIEAVWMCGDLIGLDAGMRFHMANEGYRGKTFRPFLGVRLGSYPAMVSSVVLSIVGLYLIIMIALLSED
jgi:hypothetical protein